MSEIIESMNLDIKDDAQRKEINNLLKENFIEVIEESIVASLNDDQIFRFKAIIEKASLQQEDFDAISEIIAEVPGLEQKVELALLNEYSRLNEAKNIISAN